ncbi:MAG: bifunctional 2-polyprenyl-6-hydroxyphenol methylase/3-demethylubiquinol 3-O-methyltransferase UbiG [Woeseiaceae bacterium]|nr:bifunctional 2-polyprenyl-6-hydroxyphenol methylase/3-demethylubiquinol 3-O-methyltransferase UbiG [Woeseiaceae bacterium]NIP21380.1 bifunctional 2-polyprenyl-6-hydroxyphenol methylase/3-demethylubiquinol 3-O-methyltransferase UbiG [Woeseiaceae bacterium]
MTRTNTNIDPAEIAKFDGLASRWWDPDGEFRPLHQINPVRLDWIRQKIDLAGRNVLDIGCGGGILAESMAAAGANVTAIDMAEAPLAVAQLHQLESGAAVRYIRSTAEDFAAENAGRFDMVTCLEMLEHVPRPSRVVRAVSELLRPEGDAFFSTINRNAKSFLFAIVGAEYLLRLLPRGTHDYRKLIKPSELDAWARRTGLELRSSIGLHYNPVTRDYWLADGLDVNYLMHFKSPGEYR